MLNCWRQDPHRRPNFDRVLYSVKKEAELSSPATPTVSAPTKPAGIQRGLSSSPIPLPRTMRKGSAPMISKQTGGSTSTSVEDVLTLPRFSSHASAPSQNAAPSPHSGDPPLVSRRGTFPTLVESVSHERRTARGSNRKGPSPSRATATTAGAVPQRNSGTTSSAEAGQKRSRFTGGHGAARPDDVDPDDPLRVASLASATSSRPSDDDLATSGGSALLNAKVRGSTQPRQYRVRTKSQEWAREKAKSPSHRRRKGTDPVQVAVKGVGAGLSSAPGRKVARPAADGRESRQPEAGSSHEAQNPRNADTRSGGGQAWAGGLEVVRGDRAESREGWGAGRDGSGAGNVLSKKDQKVQVLHGFRLVTPAGDGVEPSADGGISGTSSGMRGREKRRAR